jgi:uncharacterized membrane protein
MSRTRQSHRRSQRAGAKIYHGASTKSEVRKAIRKLKKFYKRQGNIHF